MQRSIEHVSVLRRYRCGRLLTGTAKLELLIDTGD
jgi:hypothetical protein